MKEIQPLSKREKLWIRALERLLRSMPERLLILECGDTLSILDRAAAKGVDLHDGRAYANGVVLHNVSDSFGKVTGVSG